MLRNLLFDLGHAADSLLNQLVSLFLGLSNFARRDAVLLDERIPGSGHASQSVFHSLQMIHGKISFQLSSLKFLLKSSDFLIAGLCFSLRISNGCIQTVLVSL
jgi:hypothetical protein